MLPTDPPRPHPDSEFRYRAELLRDFGPNVAAVHATMLAFGDDAIEITHAEVAQAAGVSVSTVQRAIKRLCDAGMLKYEQRFENHKQVSNSYRFPTAIGSSMVGQDDRAIYTCTEEEPGSDDPEIDPLVDPDVSPSLHHHHHPPHAKTRMPLRGMPGQGREAQGVGAREAGARRRNFFDLADDAYRVVDHFAENLMARDGKILREDSRRHAWVDTAMHLIVSQHRPVDEVLGVIDFCFANTRDLANEIFCEVQVSETLDHWNHWGDGYYRPVTLTRLMQIQQHYGLILNAKKRSKRISFADWARTEAC